MLDTQCSILDTGSIQWVIVAGGLDARNMNFVACLRSGGYAGEVADENDEENDWI